MNSEADATVIGPGMQIKGELTAQQGLTVLGRIEGTVRLGELLTVGAAGVVLANVEARNVVVSGTVVGNIIAHDLVRIATGGRLVGDVSCSRIAIEEGAAFRGTISMGGGAAPEATRSTTASVPASLPRSATPLPAPVHHTPLHRAVKSPSTAPTNRTDTNLASRSVELPRGASHRSTSPMLGANDRTPPRSGTKAVQPASSDAHRTNAASAPTQADNTSTRERAPRPPTAAGKKSKLKRR